MAIRRGVDVHAVFLAMLKGAQIQHPITELQFAQPRRWRFDYAWPAQKVALEVEGGVWTNGRHTRASGFLRDAEKYNHAACLGWRLLRVTPQQLPTTTTLALVRAALQEGG